MAGETLSKGFALSRSALLLVEAGYAEEAFGLTRSIYELSIYLRYITREPKDRDRCAAEYLDFGIKSKAFGLIS